MLDRGTLVARLVMISASAGLLFAQQGGQAGGSSAPPAPSTPTSPTAPASPTTTTPSPLPSTSVPLFPETPQPMFLSGKVTLQDGTPPPERAAIELCGRRVAYTDSEGRFSFQLGSTMTDATWSGNTTTGMGSPSPPVHFCAIRARLAGYRSTEISPADRRSWRNSDVGTIVLLRLGNVEGTTISMTSLAAPKDATKAFEKGREAIRKEKWADARKQLEKAVQIYPNYAAAWDDLGTALLNSGDRAAAREAFEKALAADAKFISPYVQLAALGAQEGKWEEVTNTTAKGLRLDPLNYPNLYFFDAVAHLNLRHLDQAEKSAREGLKLDTLHRFPFLHHVLGVILGNKGEYQEAAGFLKTYLELVPNAGDAAEARKRLVEIERAAQSKAVMAP